MRIRCIKPEYAADEAIAKWPPHSRLAYPFLWMEADDEGRLRANSTYLKSRWFPYEPDLDMDRVLEPIITSGKLVIYEVKGQRYGYLPNFRRHQVINKPSASKLPAPRDSGAATVILPDSSGMAPVVLPGGLEGNRDQGNGKDTAAASAHPSDEKDGIGLDGTTPEAIYAAYPRKVAKPEALRAIRKALGKVGGKVLLDKVVAYARAVADLEERFVPHPPTWFNQERYNDDPATWNPGSKKSSSVEARRPLFIERTPEPGNWRELIRVHHSDHGPGCELANGQRDWGQLLRSERDLVAALVKAIPVSERREA